MASSTSKSNSAEEPRNEISDRISLVSNCLKTIEASSQGSLEDMSPTEKSSLERAKRQLDKMQSLHRSREVIDELLLTPEDEMFADRFLEVFTTDAFREDLDTLRQTEGTNMSDSDFATLADSIKSLGLGMSQESRTLFLRHLDSQS